MPDLTGKVAVVSGAGSVTDDIGNGRAAAILLARAGARVGLLDLSLEAAKRTQQLIADEGNESFALAADATDSASASAAIAAIVDRYGRLDVLLNNVGIIGAPGDVVSVDPDDFEQVMRVNVTSILVMSKFAVPHMTTIGGGSIINVASGAALLAGHPAIAYPTSKGAVITMTRSMAYHHGPAGIRVNCVAPGFVYTPRVSLRETSPEQAAASREQRRLASPLHSEGTGWDVGRAVAYLASDDSRWVTGIVLPVDAGYSAGRV